MKRIRRDKLLRLARAGKLVAVEGYSFDDCTGESRWTGEKPVHVMARGGGHDYKGDGFYHVGEWDFMSEVGSAWMLGPKHICLYVHGNCNHTFRIVN